LQDRKVGRVSGSVLGSRIFGVVTAAGHETQVHGQPVRLGELAAQVRLDLQSHPFRDLREVLARQVRSSGHFNCFRALGSVGEKNR